jgi:hypothetical protein
MATVNRKCIISTKAESRMIINRSGKGEEMAWEMGKLSACRVPFMTSDGYLAGGCTPSASNVHGNIGTHSTLCVVLFIGDRLKATLPMSVG